MLHNVHGEIHVSVEHSQPSIRGEVTTGESVKGRTERYKLVAGQ